MISGNICNARHLYRHFLVHMYHSHRIQDTFWHPHRIQPSGCGITKPHAASKHIRGIRIEHTVWWLLLAQLMATTLLAGAKIARSTSGTCSLGASHRFWRATKVGGIDLILGGLP